MWSGAFNAITARIVQSTPTDAPSVVAAVAAAEPSSSTWLYILGGGSAVTIIGMIGRGAIAVLTGKWAEDKHRDASLVAQRDTAWRERDGERSGRERAERNVQRVIDYAGQLRYLCRIHGVPAEELPKFPELEQNPNGRSPGGVP